MKIIDALTNSNGDLQIKIQFQKITLVEQTAIIPKQETVVQQTEDPEKKAAIAAMSPEEYLQLALDNLKAECERQKVSEVEGQKQVAHLIGREL